MITYIILFILGLIIGSFLNSVIYRLGDIKTIFRERSHCPTCKKGLSWYELIPLASFILQSGRCRSCREKISWQYPLVELATAILFISIYGYFGINSYSILLLLLTCFLVIVFVYDFLYMLIPTEIIIPPVVLGIILYGYYAITLHSLSLILNPLLAGVIAGGFIGLVVWLSRGKGMGAGDIGLAFLVGLFSGYPLVILSLFSAFILGSIVGIILIIIHKKKLKSAIPFGPFLILGLYICLFWGEKLLNWYLKI